MQHKNDSEQHVQPELQQNHNMIVIHWWDYFNNPAVGIYLHNFENLMNFFQACVIKIYPWYSVRSNFVPYLLSTSVALATNSLLRMCLECFYLCYIHCTRCARMRFHSVSKVFLLAYKWKLLSPFSSKPFLTHTKCAGMIALRIAHYNVCA